MADRAVKCTRKTSETDIVLEINLDGKGNAKIDTGIGFFDHMLTSFAKHGFFDQNLTVKGDLYVDCHHTIEDTGIVLGKAIAHITSVSSIGRKKLPKRLMDFLSPSAPLIAFPRTIPVSSIIPEKLLKRYMRTLKALQNQSSLQHMLILLQ